MREFAGSLLRVAILSSLGFIGCGGEEGLTPEVDAPMGARTQAVTSYQVITKGTVPGVPAELSGLTRGDGFFFSVHRNNANWHMVITQLTVDNWALGTLRSGAQGSISFNDPEGLSYIDKTGSTWRFVAAAEGGTLRIVEMTGNTLALKASKVVGTYGNDGIEGLCYFNGYVYYGIQKDGKVYRVTFDRQTGTFGSAIESVPSTATSVRDMTVIGAGLYSISGTLLTRIAGTGAAQIRSPVALGQTEGVAYSAAQNVIMIGGEPNEYAMFTYVP